MALGKDRRRILTKGLGTMSIREVDPSAGTVFTDVGYLSKTSLSDAWSVEEIGDENGQLVDVKEKNRIARIESLLKQTTSDEFNIMRNASGKIYAARYYGMAQGDRFQYFCFPKGRINPSISGLEFKPGERNFPLAITAQDYTDENG